MRDLTICFDNRPHYDEQDYRYLVYDNPHTNERIFTRIHRRDVDRTCAVLRGQGCRLGLWSTQGWERVRAGLLDGRPL